MYRLSIPLLLVAAWPAAARELEIVVAAGKSDRPAGPVCVAVASADDLAGTTPVTLVDPAGKPIPGQLTAASLLSEKQGGRELCFIAPPLKAGQTLTLRARIPADAPVTSDQFAWQDTTGDHSDLRFGSRPVLRYMYKAIDESSKEARDRTFKVFHHLYDPTGERLVTNGNEPGAKFPHHRGLFFGFNRVSYGDKKTADVWHCTNGAFQGHEQLLASEAGPVLGRHRVQVSWNGQDKKPFAREERELTVYAVPGGTLVEFASRVKTLAGPVKLDGDPQHAGFHFRAHNDVNDKTAKQTYYLRTDGKGKPGETRNWEPKTRQGPVDLPWNAMSFVLGDKRYTAAYLDKPTNPKEARFSERDYGRFGSYFEYQVTEDRPLKVNYRLWLQDGEMTGEQVAALSQAFVEPVQVSVK